MSDERMKLAFATLGRIQAVIEMLEEPDVWQMSSEKALTRIREIVNEYKFNSSVIIA